MTNPEDKMLNKKRLLDQLQVLASYKPTLDDLNVEFVRVHANEIVQLCHQLMRDESGPEARWVSNPKPQDWIP